MFYEKKLFFFFLSFSKLNLSFSIEKAKINKTIDLNLGEWSFDVQDK